MARAVLFVIAEWPRRSLTGMQATTSLLRSGLKRLKAREHATRLIMHCVAVALPWPLHLSSGVPRCVCHSEP
eukprot:2553744-Pleurochrysis_carterae.AAC.1